MGESNLLEGPVFLPTGPFPLKGVAAAVAEQYELDEGRTETAVLCWSRIRLRYG